MTEDQLTSVIAAFSLIDARVEPRPATTVTLAESLGCVLTTDIMAECDQPAFDRSAIDGFAVAAGAAAGDFTLVGDILPGDPAPATPAAGAALRLFTGSAVPPNCGLVMQEDTSLSGDRVTLRQAASEKMIRHQGSSARAGTRLLAAGDRIGPGELAVLASVGAVQPRVIPSTRVLHFTTGREVVPSGTMPGPGQIRDTNGPLVRAMLTAAGVSACAPRHVDESANALVAAVQAAGDFDLLLVSGGSSVGEHDHTPEALEALGFELLVRRVDVRPGKPLLIAQRGQQWAFGLPGNPVSHFATFHVFVARALRRMRGLPTAAFHRVRLAAGAPCLPGKRETFWPARLDALASPAVVHPRPWLDSGDLAALVGVNALIRLPAGFAPVVGDEVEIVACPETV